MENGFLKNLLKRVKLNESFISMVLGALVIVVIGALIVNYFRNAYQPTEEISQEETETIATEVGEVKLIKENGQLIPEDLPAKHQVNSGEDLWTIAEKYYGSGYNWVDIAQENNLTNPDLIETGQELTIPKSALRQPLVSQEADFGPVIEGGSYTVEKGDHLWGIAVRAYGDGYRWTEIAQANELNNPDFIHPGNTLTIPR